MTKLTFITQTIFMLSAPLCLMAKVLPSRVPVTNWSHEALRNIHQYKHKLSKKQLTEIDKVQNQFHNHLRFMTWNILFDNFDQDLAKKNRWSKRRDNVLKVIKELSPEVLATQETQKNQSEYLRQNLKYEYLSTCTSAARKKFDLKDNFDECIYFKKNRFQRLESKIYYASENPEKPSKHSLAKFPSVIHKLKLKDKKTRKTWVIINIHLDFFSPEVREESLHIVGELFKNEPSKNQILMGDFNSFPYRSDLDIPWFDGSHMDYTLRSYKLTDSFKTSILGHRGPIATFTSQPETPGLAFMGHGVPGVRLDHIYTSNQVTPIMHIIYQNIGKIGSQASDHLPVILDAL